MKSLSFLPFFFLSFSLIQASVIPTNKNENVITQNRRLFSSNPIQLPPIDSNPFVPPTPDQDPFYTSADGYQDAQNGDVLKSRQVVLATLGLVPEPIEAYQLQYRTQSTNGTAITSVTTVMVPFNANSNQFVNFQTAEDSNGQQCAPSYTYRLGANQQSVIASAENLILQSFLVQGYIVNSPDYEGPDGAFTAGYLAGTGVLDSIRAVKNFASNVGLVSEPEVVAVGYSGGGIATGWASSIQDSYAPDLNDNIKGWCAGGVPANLTAIVPFIDGTIWAGFLPAAIVGLSAPSAYGSQVQPIIDEIATASGKAALAFAAENCAGADLGKFAFQRVESTKFQTLGPNFLYEPTISKVVNNQTMGMNPNYRPKQPMRIYHSLNDEIIPYPDTASLVDRWCDQGSSIDFTTISNGGHATGELAGAVIANQYVNDVFSGKVSNSGCTRDAILTNILNPIALGFSLEPILIQLIDLLGQAGENDSNIIANPSLLF